MTHVTRVSVTERQLTAALKQRWNGLMYGQRGRNNTLCPRWKDFECFNEEVRAIPGFSVRLVYEDYTMLRVDRRDPFDRHNSLFIPGNIRATSTRRYMTIKHSRREKEWLIVNVSEAVRTLNIYDKTLKSHADSEIPIYGMQLKWAHPTALEMHEYIRKNRAYY
jgi:hypothetical protein